MDAMLDNARLALPKEGLIALRDGGDTRITCLEGTLWVTQEGTIKDEVLEPGQSLVVRHPGLTLVTALVPAVVTLTSGATKHFAAPQARNWLGLQPRLGAR
jgi:hypothetical protein